MPIHDWTLVSAPSFNDMHQSWLVLLKIALNTGRLPEGYFAHTERHFGRFESDILTLSTPSAARNGTPRNGDDRGGGVAVAVRRPQAGVRLSASPVKQSTLAVRRVGTDRVVALIELASPSNKDRAASVTAYVEKAKAALEHGVHVVHLDMLPPTPHTPANLSSAIWDAVDGRDYPFDLAKPFAADSFVADRVTEVYANSLGLGDEWPDAPLFLDAETYIELPLAATYAQAFAGVAPADKKTLAPPGA
jgi:Protein of unknown function (DUF4058)